MKLKRNEILQSKAISFFKDGLKSIDPIKLINSRFKLKDNILICSDIFGVSKKYNLEHYERIFVVGAGKASAKMAKAVEDIISDKIFSGLVVTKYGFTCKLNKIELIEAGHPLPDENGVKGAEKIISLCNEANENDLIINLISGGASALLPNPTGDLSLQNKIDTTRILLEAGSTIEEVNTIRMHLSGIKGGQLARSAFPATIVSLILSDVIGDRLDIIGSGITFPSATTFKECWRILEKYNILKVLPKPVVSHLEKGRKGIISQMPKGSDSVFDKVDNLIIGNNSVILKSIELLAKESGYKTKIISSNLSGEAKEVGRKIVKDAITFSKEKKGMYCFLYGGETSVVITGTGKGGRNQELILSAAIELSNQDGIIVLSGGTDGNDGPTDAAGAICDGRTISRGKAHNLNAEEFLANNDSYNYFNKIGELVITGPTNTNVMDIQIVLIENSVGDI